MFDIEHILVIVWGYPLSFLEAIATVSGLICVWLAAKENILTWSVGIINIICLFAMFYQVRLYSDMLLQIYFFGVAIYGWISWHRDKQNSKPIRQLSFKEWMYSLLIIVVFSCAMGLLIKNIHHLLPSLFPHTAAYPYLDSFIAVGSIVANIYMARRIIDHWVLWFLIDVVCVFVYMQKNILFIAMVYGIYLLIAFLGFFKWQKLRMQANGSREMR